MSEEIKQELRRFAESTTIKGVSRTVKAPRTAVRVFWMLALTCCLGAGMYQAGTIAFNYSRHNVIRSSGLVQKVPDFPDVTVCNLFPLSDLSRLEYFDDYTRMLDEAKRAANITFDGSDYLWMFLRSLHSYNVNTEIPSPSEPKISESLLIDCNMYGWDLYMPRGCDNFSQFLPPLQWCKTIQPGKTAEISKSAAISMLLFVNDLNTQMFDFYYDWIRLFRSSGIRLMVHRSGMIPCPLSAINISPGTETTVFLTQTDVTRLQHPYGNCTNQRLLDPNINNSPLYNWDSCIDLCRQRQLVKRCGCVDHYTLFTEAELLLTNYTFCTNMTQALERVSENMNYSVAVNRSFEMILCVWSFVTMEEKCDCQPQCQEISYTTRVTTTHWPKPTNHLAFYTQYIQNQSQYSDDFRVYETIKEARDSKNLSVKDTLKLLEKVKLIEENFLQVSVMFDGKSVRLVEEVSAMTWETLASNLGGSFNLWLGISVPTVAEIIELVYSMVIIWWRRKKRNVEEPFEKEKQTTIVS